MASTVYSVTSYQMLRRDAIECERHNRLHPDAEGKLPYVQKVLGNTKGPVVATSDYMRALAEQVGPYLDGRLFALGTDGFGRSETRQEPAPVLRGGRRERGGRGLVRSQPSAASWTGRR